MLQITISRRSAFMIVLAVVLTVPAVAFAGTLFDDVDDTDTHIDGITFMKNSGVTVGCGPNVYCPGDPVTRAQMATFMYRLSGTDPATDPSVNADTVDGLDADEILPAAYSTFNDGPIDISVAGPHLTLTGLPAGSYVVVAKIALASVDASPATVICGVTTGTDFDESLVRLANSGAPGDSDTLPLTVVHTYVADNGTVDLICDTFGADVLAGDAKITAIRVGDLTNTFGG